MSETGWIEITCMGDEERKFVSYDGSQYRSEPFEDVSYSGDWRVEFGRGFGRGLGSAADHIPLLLSLVAVAIAAAACALSFSA